MEMQMPFLIQAKKLTRLREQHGKSQAQACAHVCSERQYQRYEQGARPRRRAVLLDILLKNLELCDAVVINALLKGYRHAPLTPRDMQFYRVPDPHFTTSSPGLPDTEGMEQKNGSAAKAPGVPVPQEVKGRSKYADDVTEPTGIIINKDPRQFIAWPKVKIETEQQIFPYVRMIPIGSHVELGKFEGRLDWIARIIDPKGNEIGNVWYGGDPLKNYTYDGLVHVGVPGDETREPIVWQVFQRYSNGTYIRVANPYDASLRPINRKMDSSKDRSSGRGRYENRARKSE
jgi:hypothetical protein